MIQYIPQEIEPEHKDELEELLKPFIAQFLMSRGMVGGSIPPSPPMPGPQIPSVQGAITKLPQVPNLDKRLNIAVSKMPAALKRGLVSNLGKKYFTEDLPDIFPELPLQLYEQRYKQLVALCQHKQDKSQSKPGS